MESKMKNIKLFFVSLLVLVSIFAQNNIVNEIDAASSSRGVVMFQNQVTPTDYIRIGTYSLNGYSEVYRCGFLFTYNIPSNARILSAELYGAISNTGATGQCSINLLGSFNFSGVSDAEFYSILAGGSNIATIQNNNCVTVDVKSHIAGQSSFYVGFIGNPESAKFQSVNARLTIKYELPVVFTVKNDPDAGVLNVDGNIVSSGTQVSRYLNETVTLGAIEQMMPDGYFHMWGNSNTNPARWDEITQSGRNTCSSSRNFSITVTSSLNSKIICAVLPKLCNLSVNSNRAGVSLNINGNTTTIPSGNIEIIEGNDVLITANNFLDNTNFLFHAFNNWENGSASATRTISNISSHTQITAIYKTQAIGWGGGLNLAPGLQYDQPIQLVWQDHPDPNVTGYYIERWIKGEGTVRLAWVDRGVQFFEDATMVYKAINDPDAKSCQYSMIAFYAPDQTESGPTETICISGEEGALAKTNDGTGNNNKTAEKPQNSLSNFPNPFNPSTVVSFSIKNAGAVQIQVYDILGRIVSTLVDGYKEAGKYSVSFNASDLPSGIYICSIKANGFAATQKMILAR